MCIRDRPQSFHIATDERARFRAIIDEQGEFSAPRHSFQPQRARASEQVNHPPAIRRIVIGMDENIEQALAQTVRCRANGAGAWPPQHPPFETTADNPHGAGSQELATTARRLAARRTSATTRFATTRAARRLTLASAPGHRTIPVAIRS